MRLQRRQQGVTPRARQTIRQPVAIKAALQSRCPLVQCRSIRLPRLWHQPRQPGGPAFRILKIGTTIAQHRQIGCHHHRHRSCRPLRLTQQRLHPVQPRRPVGGIGPGAVDHDQQRAIAAAFRGGIKHRPGKAHYRRRHRQHPQQQQPPRGAVALMLIIGQPQQQRNAGKPAHHRCRWHGTQQQPQHRQSHQCSEQQWCQKSHGAEGEHQAPRSSA